MLLKDQILAEGQKAFSKRHKMPIAFLAVIMGLLVIPVDFFASSLIEDRLWEIVCLAIAAFGSFLRFHSNGYAAPATSGRDKETPTAASLNTKGFYSLTRNPLYLGNIIIMVGVIASSQNLYAVIIISLLLFMYYERVIMAEENFLAEKFGDAFDRWSAEVPFLFPRLSGWQSPETDFRWRAAFKREIYSITAIPSSIFLIDVFEHYEHKMDFIVDPVVLGLFIAMLVVFQVFRILKKKTAFFDD